MTQTVSLRVAIQKIIIDYSDGSNEFPVDSIIDEVRALIKECKPQYNDTASKNGINHYEDNLLQSLEEK